MIYLSLIFVKHSEKCRGAKSTNEVPNLPKDPEKLNPTRAAQKRSSTVVVNKD
jgi:hypothetical protein